MPSEPSDTTPSAAPGDAETDVAGLDFESALAELEALVNRMEAGDMTLEASLAAFERGVKLTRHCQAALRDAELKVKKLTEDDEFEDLDPDAFDDD